MNMIKCLLFIILTCNLKAFASLNKLRPLAQLAKVATNRQVLARSINAKATTDFLTQLKPISADDKIQTLKHLRDIVCEEVFALNLDAKEHYELISNIINATSYQEAIIICKKTLTQFCLDQEKFVVKKFNELDPEIQYMILKKIGEDYKSLSKEEFAEFIKNIQTCQEETIKKSEKILKIMLPLSVGIIATIPTTAIINLSIYIIDLISG